MTETAIAARGLTKRFGKVVALDKVDLEIPRGSSLGVIGPGGSGKSTLVRVLAGLVRPSAGSATILGVRAGSAAARRHLGVLLQDAALYEWMRAREALAFAADLGRIEAGKMPARISEVAAQLDVEESLDRRVSALPLAIRGRLAIAQVLVADPDVVLLDEPFHWVDPEARAQVLGALAGLRGARTLVIAARRWADVRALCDRVVVLAGGRVVLDGATADLAARLSSVYVVETAAAPGLALAGVVARLRSEPWIREVSADGGTLRIAVADPDRAARELLAAFIGAGVPVATLRREEGSFEELVARHGRA